MLRLTHRAPYRCDHCGWRFIARVEATALQRQVSLADYLGLQGWSRRFFSDEMIVTGLTSLLLLLTITMFFSVALGWVDPHLLRARNG